MNGIEYLLDTNIVIGILKADPATVELLEKYPKMLDSSAISQITRMELLGFPGLQCEDEQKIQAFLENCPVLLLNEDIEHAAIVLRRTGQFRLPDAIIAATAQFYQLRLMTLDIRFARALQSYL